MSIVVRSKMLAAAMSVVAVMATSATAQNTRDYADAVNNRLVINGKPLFISGMSIAWHSFGNDLNDDSPIDEFTFSQYIKDVRKAGGNAVRWWLHNDASFCPKIDANGNVTGLAKYSIESMQKVLDIAYENGVVVAMCLFSHNLFVPGTKSTWSDYDINRNYKLFTNADKMDTYIQYGLRPILEAVGNHPAVMCWEVFNEPEGMTTEHGWSDMAQTISYDNVIKFTAKVAAEVHKRTVKMASTGIHEFNKSSYFPRYTAANLKAAANDTLGYLDFYMAHYYPQFQGTGAAMSPFQNNASHWGLDKPVLIGEFPGRSWAQMTITNAFNYAYNNGYVGALSWSMTDAEMGSIEETAPALKNLFENHKNDIMIKEVDIEDLTGDLVMKLNFNAHPVGDDNEALLKKEISLNLQGKSNLTFEMYIDQNSGSSLQVYPALQGNEASDWEWYQSAAINLSGYADRKGEWVTVSVPLNTFNVDNGVGIYAAFLKFVASGTPFTGVIYIDNIKIDSDVLSDFNDSKAWGKEKGASLSLDIVVRAGVGGTNSVFNGGKRVSASAGRVPYVVVKGRILNVISANNSDMRINVVDIKGKTAAKFKSSGSGQFSLAKIPVGRYIVETKIGGKRVSSTAVIVK